MKWWPEKRNNDAAIYGGRYGKTNCLICFNWAFSFIWNLLDMTLLGDGVYENQMIGITMKLS